jgi:hypothetical protein
MRTLPGAQSGRHARPPSNNEADTMSERKIDLTEKVNTRVLEAVAAATDEDRVAAADLIQHARSGSREPRLVTMTPGMAAIIFTRHNGQNRDFRESKALGFADLMTKRRFAYNTQTIGFLTNGNLGDGQHRVLGQIMSGTTQIWNVAFGMQVEDIQTVDIGTPRQASDYLDIIGVSHAKLKEHALRTVYAYLAWRARKDKTDDKPARWRLPSKPDIIAAVQQNNHLLDKAITLGERFVTNVTKPIMEIKEATTFAFLMLYAGEWPEDRLIEKLAAFQLGHGDSVGGANSPRFLAGTLLAKDESKKGEKIPAVGRLAVAVKAFVLEESGAAAIRVSELRAAIKNPPDPHYPKAPAVAAE